ncbi:histidine kinase [Conexibacter sp. JD483]|uniref:sensor histidine kinase n=1 Tax=unclassified Conexibacter TaxID=2627773 RepID=UPI00271BBC3C|nr:MULTISPECIES: histidine kinase [unclassified Conexibacter]MDO8187288.1 histidine kinase [Conexibacter sp. CPCC 205706]MDO8198897.1 histidine kinase [Conexibacter sp. CPCC 205762]MDR9370636.1 histidine kinase [Conexibacter sp. JD483]
MSLLQRIFTLNVAVIVLAGLLLALTPATVSSEIARLEAVVLLALLAAVSAVDYVLLRRALAPLRRLTGLMETVEPLHPGRRLPSQDAPPELRRLTEAFNRMLDRLEDERRGSVARSLTAQEAERLRVARELHDGIGQSLTALMLQIDRVAKHAPPPLDDELTEAREATRALMGEVRDVALRLRPEALDDLGLEEALAALCDRVGAQGGIAVRLTVAPALPPLSEQAELVIYRVAQEALTNTLRHAGARSAELTLGPARTGDTGAGALALTARDDGRGLGASAPGAGIQGMHERALLLGGSCSLTAVAADGGGTEVRLLLPRAAVAAVAA